MQQLCGNRYACSLYRAIQLEVVPGSDLVQIRVRGEKYGTYQAAHAGYLIQGLHDGMHVEGREWFNSQLAMSAGIDDDKPS